MRRDNKLPPLSTLELRIFKKEISKLLVKAFGRACERIGKMYGCYITTETRVSITSNKGRKK